MLTVFHEFRDHFTVTIYLLFFVQSMRASAPAITNMRASLRTLLARCKCVNRRWLARVCAARTVAAATQMSRPATTTTGSTVCVPTASLDPTARLVSYAFHDCYIIFLNLNFGLEFQRILATPTRMPLAMAELETDVTRVRSESQSSMRARASTRSKQAARIAALTDSTGREISSATPSSPDPSATWFRWSVMM